MQRKLSIPTGLSIFLVLSLIIPMTLVSAVAPIPTYGTAVVNGYWVDEWDVSGESSPDFFAHMYRAADPGGDNLSDLYLRYECINGGTHARLYALVMITPPASKIDRSVDDDNHYIKLSSDKLSSELLGSDKVISAEDGNNGRPPDFAWIAGSGETTIGWEASSIEVPVGDYTLNTHTQVDNDQTSAVDGRGIPLTLICDPTAVELDLVSLVAEFGPDGVVVRWETQSEFNLQGFNILRAESESGPMTQVNEQLRQAEQAPGSMELTSYDFLDGTAAAGASYLYWLQAVDTSGDTEEFGPVPVLGTPFYPSGPQDALHRVFLPLIRQ